MKELKFFANEVNKLTRTEALDSLILYVTSRCNAKCGFCCYGDELNRIPEMGLDEIVKVSQNLKSLKGLLIGGGEPFLRTDLIDIIRAFVNNCGIKVVQIPTNGYFTDRTVSFVNEITTEFPDLNLSIQISLDMLGEKHDEIRELKNCFERAEQTAISLLQQRETNQSLRVLVVSVLTAETIPTCKDLAEYVREQIKPDYHWFEPVRDVADSDKQLELTEDTIHFLRDNLNYYLTHVKGASSSIYSSRLFNGAIKSFSLNNFDIAYNRLTHQRNWPVSCCAGKQMAVLYPDGMLAACELRQERVNIKNFNYDINEALKQDVFQVVRKDIRNHACDCTHGCFIPTSVRYSPFELFRVAGRSFRSVP